MKGKVFHRQRDVRVDTISFFKFKGERFCSKAPAKFRCHIVRELKETTGSSTEVDTS